MTAIDPTLVDATASQAPADTWQPSRRLALVCLVAIAAVAASLRFPTLAQQSIWIDEVASYVQARGGFIEMLQATAADNYPPLYNVLLWFSIKLFGEAEWVLRLPSAILGLANVFAIYWVGTLLGDRKTGLVAAMLLALSAFHSFYSQEARMYALLALTATLFAGTVIVLVDRRGLAWSVAAIAAGTALLYSHPYGLLIWGAILAGAAAGGGARSGARERLLQLGIVAAGTALAFSPWAVIMANRAVGLAENGFWIGRLTFQSFLEVLGELTSAQLALITALSVVGAVALWARRPAGWTIIAWAILPFAAAIAYSLLVQPMFIARYCIGMLPATFLLAGHGVSLLGKTRTLMAAAAVGVALSSAYGLYAGTPPEREDWRGVVAWLNTEVDGPTDCIVFTKWLSFDYYEPAAKCLNYANRPEQLRQDGYPGRVFVVATHIGKSRLDALLAALTPAQGKPVRHPFNGVDVYSFERR